MKESMGVPNKEGNNISRGSFLKKIGILTAGVLVTGDVLAKQESTQEFKEQNRTIELSEIKEMERNGDLHEGFSRYKINLKFQGDQEKKIEGAGSFFSIEDTAKGKVEFLSNKQHPELFVNGVSFDAIEKHYKDLGKEVTLIVAGAYYAQGTKDIEGIALENGKVVGQGIPKIGSNGLLVIKDGNPEIQYVNQITDLNTYIEERKKAGDSMFQQTSYLRPGGKFTSKLNVVWELRFFVEGEMNGKVKKGIVNFSTAMTYTEAVEAMTTMDGFKINKAIGLDTGSMSEGYFYSKQEGKPDTKNLMIDEKVGTHRADYTNVVVFCNR